jgi:excisionase family DNA binding protein
MGCDMTPRDRLLTTREVAGILGVSAETVLRWWRAGRVPGVRLASNVLRFRESAVDAMIAEAEGRMILGELREVTDAR